MKTFIISNNKKGYRSSTATIVDFEKHEVASAVDIRINAGINDIYVADAPMEVRYQIDGNTIVKKADKGDIIITFYKDFEMMAKTKSTPGFLPVVVVKNADWKKNIAVLNAEREADQAKKESLSEFCNTCCDSCTPCCG